MMCRERLEAYLRRNQAPYGIHRHPPAPTARRVAEHEHIPGRLMVQVLVVFADGKPAMLALPTSREVDLALVGAALNAREVRLASKDELAATCPDCEADALPPFGNLYNLPVYADRSLEGDRAIFFQAGASTTALSVAYADFKRLVAPTVAEFTHVHKRPSLVSPEDARTIGG